MLRDNKDRCSKVTVVLLDRQVASLDYLAVELRMKTQQAFSRTELIGAIIEAAGRSGLTGDDVLALKP